MDSHLLNTYGHKSFRDGQENIISAILAGQSVLAIMPTGGGKSLLYQFPATYTGKSSVVVSPLISLMNDQAANLTKRGIASVCLNSESTLADKIRLPSAKVIYTTPEYIVSERCALWNGGLDIGLIAIDEAHCISQWSHDFRPAYKSLACVRRHCPAVPILAVTATATPKVIDEMKSILSMNDCLFFQQGTHRDNLRISVHSKTDFGKCDLSSHTIVYVQTRKACESLCQKIRAKGVTAEMYHGGMSKREKQLAHMAFMDGSARVVVATISFGMGIDKGDIRHVVNYGVPTDIETYYQEIGRAGRDGKESKASLFYDNSDFTTARTLIGTCPCAKQRKYKHAALNSLRQYLANKSACRQFLIEEYFRTGKLGRGQLSSSKTCGLCDNCTATSARAGKDMREQLIAIREAVNTQVRKSGYGLGTTRTMVALSKLPAFQHWTKKAIRACLEEAITQEVVVQEEVRAKKGRLVMVIMPGPCMPERVSVSTHSIKYPSASTLVRRDLQAYRYRKASLSGLPEDIVLSDNVLRTIAQNPTDDNVTSLVSASFRAGVRAVISSAVKRYDSALREWVADVYKAGSSVLMHADSARIAHKILDVIQADEEMEMDLDFFGITEDLEERILATIANNKSASDTFVASKTEKGALDYQVRALRLLY